MRVKVTYLGSQNYKEKITIQAQEQSDNARLRLYECPEEMLAAMRRIRRKARMKLLTSNR